MSSFEQLAAEMLLMFESKADDIRDLLSKGLTVGQVAKATGAHYSQVHGIAKKITSSAIAPVSKAKVAGIPQSDILAAGETPTSTKKLEAHAGTPWIQLPEDLKEEAYNIVAQHNDSPKIDPTIGAEYWVDVTGKHHVFYTLWRYRTDSGSQQFANYIKNPTYMGNLSIDLLGAVEKACKKVRENVRIRLMTDENRTRIQGKPERFRFGKYRGELFTDVFLQDPGYFMFLARSADPRYGVDPQVAAFADMAKQEITEKNRETSKSQYLGEIGTKLTVTGTVYNVREEQEPSFGAQYRSAFRSEPKYLKVYRLEDNNGNKFIASRLNKIFPDIDKGSTVTFSATIHGKFESMGIKFTKLTRPKLPK